MKTIHNGRKDVRDRIGCLNAIRRVYKEFCGFRLRERGEKKCVEGGLTTRDAIGKMKGCDT